MQLVIYSKHRVLLNNYLVTVVGVLDTAQQFNMIALAVSNKEDGEMFYCNPTFICTMADNSDPIQRALRRCFPGTVIG